MPSSGSHAPPSLQIAWISPANRLQRSMKPREQATFRFGRFVLVPAERLLLADGKAVALTGKAFDLLVALVRQPGHLLTKDELLRAVWPDVVVEEVNLSVNVSALRKVLGAAPGRGVDRDGAATRVPLQLRGRGRRRRHDFHDRTAPRGTDDGHRRCHNSPSAPPPRFPRRRAAFLIGGLAAAAAGMVGWRSLGDRQLHSTRPLRCCPSPSTGPERLSRRWDRRERHRQPDASAGVARRAQGVGVPVQGRSGGPCGCRSRSRDQCSRHGQGCHETATPSRLGVELVDVPETRKFGARRTRCPLQTCPLQGRVTNDLANVLRNHCRRREHRTGGGAHWKHARPTKRICKDATYGISGRSRVCKARSFIFAALSSSTHGSRWPTRRWPTRTRASATWATSHRQGRFLSPARMH